MSTPSWPFDRVAPSQCPRSPHRGPTGPNEDMARCVFCGSPSWQMRPWGETVAAAREAWLRGFGRRARGLR